MRASNPQRGFTVIELLIVMAIIVVLAGLVLGTYSYVQRKGSTSRAEAEIKALEAASESYKADNGVYPRDPSITDALDPRTDFNPNDDAYKNASLVLYKALSGDADGNGTAESGNRTYMPFKPQMLSLDASNNVLYIRDPFGNSYGYATVNQVDPAKGYNPTFDLWSTGGTGTGTEAPNPAKWIKNW